MTNKLLTLEEIERLEGAIKIFSKETVDFYALDRLAATARAYHELKEENDKARQFIREKYGLEIPSYK